MKKFLAFSICLLFGIIGSGCDQTVLPNPEHDKFIQLGMKMAGASFPGISVVSAQVDHATAERVTHGEMEKRLGGGAVGVDPNKSVWVVTLNGKFSYALSRASGGQILVSPKRIFVFDANTGTLLQAQ